MPHYITKDVNRTVNATPLGWVGALPTWPTNMHSIALCCGGKCLCVLGYMPLKPQLESNLAR